MPLTSELIVCITSSALFDCSEAHEIWKRDGLVAYQAHHCERLMVPLKPGVGFPLVQSLLALNNISGKNLVDVVLISRIDGESGERVRNSIIHHDLSIRRMSFTAGTDVIKYLTAWKCDLFLSTEEEQVRAVLHTANSLMFEGIAAGLVYDRKIESTSTQLSPLSSEMEKQASKSISTLIDATRWPEDQVRIAFDGDGVLFSDEAERVFREHGLMAFNLSEQDKEHIPLSKGPMHKFALKIQKIRSELGPDQNWRIRTFLVTARAKETTKRGLNKTPFLRIIDPAIFFDDSSVHIERAKQYVPSAHVIYSTKNSRNNTLTSESTPQLTAANDNENLNVMDRNQM
ncbi:unnamed protein product [Rotaria socialis]